MTSLLRRLLTDRWWGLTFVSQSADPRGENMLTSLAARFDDAQYAQPGERAFVVWPSRHRHDIHLHRDHRLGMFWPELADCVGCVDSFAHQKSDTGGQERFHGSRLPDLEG